MSNGDEKPTASSWRDVYDLVRDTRADIMVAVGNVDTKVSALAERVGVIEKDRHDEKLARQTEAQLATDRNRKLLTLVAAGRNGIAILISIASFVLVVLKS